MAEKKPRKTEEKEVKAATAPLPRVDVKKEAVKVVTPKPPPKEVVAEPLVPFERWFRVRAREKKYRTHWVDGMRAFTDVTKRRTMGQWDSVFAKY